MIKYVNVEILNSSEIQFIYFVVSNISCGQLDLFSVATHRHGKVRHALGRVFFLSYYYFYKIIPMSAKHPAKDISLF